jgi:nucleosome binding factor SPN SPT16 subunit
MVFNLALGLENLEDKDATDSRGKKYALFLADTVLVKVPPSPSNPYPDPDPNLTRT